jgi:hypothetical protein
MAAIGAITVFDGAATPVSHTLQPVSVTRERGQVVAYWREALASIPTEAQVWATAELSNLPNGVTKEIFTVGVPVMETVTNQNAAGYSAAPKLAFTDKMVFTAFSSKRSTVTSRRLARQILVNIANNVSTSVAAATTGPLPDLVDQLFAPT